jgi:hypothetical protein
MFQVFVGKLLRARSLAPLHPRRLVHFIFLHVALVYGAWPRYVDQKIGLLSGKVETTAIGVRVAVKSFFVSVFDLQAMTNY